MFRLVGHYAKARPFGARGYAKAFKVDKEHTQNEQFKKRSFKWLLILGALAIGSSFLASSQGAPKRLPRQSLETIVEENEEKNKKRGN